MHPGLRYKQGASFKTHNNCQKPESWDELRIPCDQFQEIPQRQQILLGNNEFVQFTLIIKFFLL